MKTIIVEIDIKMLRRAEKETLYDFYKKLQREIEKISGIRVISINNLLIEDK